VSYVHLPFLTALSSKKKKIAIFDNFWKQNNGKSELSSLQSGQNNHFIAIFGNFWKQNIAQ